jgi:hypothetical protein
VLQREGWVVISNLKRCFRQNLTARDLGDILWEEHMKDLHLAIDAIDTPGPTSYPFPKIMIELKLNQENA